MIADGHLTLWWFTLAGGLVVALVVAGLLALLVRLVGQIDEGVRAAWESATRVAANTSTTWMLGRTAELVGELHEEMDEHVAFLEEAR